MLVEQKKANGELLFSIVVYDLLKSWAFTQRWGFAGIFCPGNLSSEQLDQKSRIYSWNRFETFSYIESNVKRCCIFSISLDKIQNSPKKDIDQAKCHFYNMSNHLNSRGHFINFRYFSIILPNPWHSVNIKFFVLTHTLTKGPVYRLWINFPNISVWMDRLIDQLMGNQSSTSLWRIILISRLWKLSNYSNYTSWPDKAY